jgi:predicted Abi (CAAX) family protease
LLARARERAGRDEALTTRLEALSARLEAAAGPAAAAVAQAMTAKDDSWVDSFWDFRARFGATAAARDALATYQKLREKHKKPAQERFERARSLQDEGQKQALYREIVREYYASRGYRLVKRWIKP